jgi:hypothetical protein
MFVPNFLIIALSALVPTFVGFIWYNPKVFGNIWMKEAGVSPESGKGMNMGIVMVLCYVLSFLAGMSLNFIVIHQFGLTSMLQNVPDAANPNSEVGQHVKYLLDNYGTNFRSFKHGALHGTLTGVFLALPIVATGAMFEQRSWKYIAISAGYWILTFMLMGGLICQFS